MVNEREKQVLEQYEKEGWKTIRCGAPDFLFIKTNGEKIIDCCFVEVKSPRTDLSYGQFIWKKVIEDHGGCYKIEVIK